MIALDTNVLARFYVDDPDDPEAMRQRPAARAAMAQPALFVPVTVMLELEWVMRAFYGFTPAQFARVVKHLAGLSHVTVETSANVLAALQDHLQGLDFADALHLRASSQCRAMFSFDERRFARKAKRLGLLPAVVPPSA